MYQNFTNIENAWRKGELSEYISCLTTNYFQKKIEHSFSSIFKGFLNTLHEPPIKETLGRPSHTLNPRSRARRSSGWARAWTSPVTGCQG